MQKHRIYMLSEKMRVFFTPYPGKAHPGYSGIMAHYKKRAENWETHKN